MLADGVCVTLRKSLKFIIQKIFNIKVDLKHMK